MEKVFLHFHFVLNNTSFIKWRATNFFQTAKEFLKKNGEGRSKNHNAKFSPISLNVYIYS